MRLGGFGFYVVGKRDVCDVDDDDCCEYILEIIVGRVDNMQDAVKEFAMDAKCM